MEEYNRLQLEIMPPRQHVIGQPVIFSAVDDEKIAKLDEARARWDEASEELRNFRGS